MRQSANAARHDEPQVPVDFESAESCSLPHEGDACVPWAAFALFDRAGRALCRESAFEPGTMSPFLLAEYDPAGRTDGERRRPGFRAELTLPAEAVFSPLVEARCDLGRMETLPLAGMRLHLLVGFPEERVASPRFFFRLHEDHLLVEGAAP